MKKLAVILSVVGALIFLLATGYFLYSYLVPKEAGVSVDTLPSSDVYINGVKVGKTPYEATRKPGEITIKLVPNSQGNPLPFFETKLVLNPGIKTIVKRSFGDSEDTSSGQIVSFEKTGETSFSLVSVPDSSQVSLDGNVIGFSPIKVSTISPGSHQLIVSADGYGQERISINIVAGYKLIAIVKLARLNLPKPSPTPTPQTKTFIEILPTPTGFLRVREQPSQASQEIAQVKPGEKFPLIEEDSSGQWFKIEYLTGAEGWVSSQFAKKVEETI